MSNNTRKQPATVKVPDRTVRKDPKGGKVDLKDINITKNSGTPSSGPHSPQTQGIVQGDGG